MYAHSRHAGSLLLVVLLACIGFGRAKPAHAVSSVNVALIPAAADLDWIAIADEAEDPRVHLLAIAQSYALLEQVPYVWGGNKVGDASACAACRRCLNTKKRTKVEKRHRACGSCQACGMDCSHFVNRVYEDAGLDYRYASTGQLSRTSVASVASGLVAVGKDLAQALPGDLLLYPNHVIMLLQRTSEQRGDFIHVSRSARRDRLGGIEIVRDYDLSSFRGKLIKILRHESLHELDQSTVVSHRKAPWSPIN